MTTSQEFLTDCRKLSRNANLPQPVRAFVLVELKKQSANALQDFEDYLVKCRVIDQVNMISGGFDYMLIVTCSCISELEQFRREILAGHRSVLKTCTHICLDPPLSSDAATH